ncbi:unnamed protein product [Prorocentrum cordatum]|uniref:Pentatricopeptide repeat-containing protein, chloroplastic n=1 Tax=Prorocentrum cordatum TaxID=2364126 RepID=A0ABN9SMA5_9DINO|nr:unnamed protein product [Polarella glacialis]
MREAKLEPSSTVSYSAGISACEKGEQWQRALALLSEMWEAKLEPDVISYSAGISACEKGEQWQRALALLSEMRQAKMEPNSATALGSARARRASSGSGLCYNAGISASGKGEQWARALALLSELREAKLEPNVIYCNAGISACEKGEQWQRALALLSEMWEVTLESSVTSYNAGISACGKGEQWPRALGLLSEMREAKLKPDGIFSYNAVICACERCGQWQQALSQLGEMRESNLEPNGKGFNFAVTACERSSRDSAGFPGYLQIGLLRFRVSCEALFVWDPTGHTL